MYMYVTVYLQNQILNLKKSIQTCSYLVSGTSPVSLYSWNGYFTADMNKQGSKEGCKIFNCVISIFEQNFTNPASIIQTLKQQHKFTKRDCGQSKLEIARVDVLQDVTAV